MRTGKRFSIQRAKSISSLSNESMQVLIFVFSFMWAGLSNFTTQFLNRQLRGLRFYTSGNISLKSQRLKRKKRPKKSVHRTATFEQQRAVSIQSPIKNKGTARLLLSNCSLVLCCGNNQPNGHRCCVSIKDDLQITACYRRPNDRNGVPHGPKIYISYLHTSKFYQDQMQQALALLFQAINQYVKSSKFLNVKSLPSKNFPACQYYKGDSFLLTSQSSVQSSMHLV